MKVLAIIGSPRKKNTYDICKLIEEKMKTMEQVEFNYVFLHEANLELCRGCMLCYKKGEKFCPIKDCISSIWSKMSDSDALILASPVYAHQVTSLMKNFIDRSAFMFHRPSFFDKSALVLSTTAGSGLNDVLKYLKDVARWFGFSVVGSLGVITTAFEHSLKYKEKISNDLDSVATRLIEAVKTGKRPSPDIYDLILFGVFKEKAKHIESDREFWQNKGWFDKDYYIDLPINPVNKFIANHYLKKMRKKNMKIFK
ncbi:MAG: NAD(P)H-dependent oxidoreductase [Candidatus Theseobacter exili]|nr:NAD(P)H-dependent oxidoreductase [Candidatus Theseobacter exili]